VRERDWGGSDNIISNFSQGGEGEAAPAGEPKKQHDGETKFVRKSWKSVMLAGIYHFGVEESVRSRKGAGGMDIGGEEHCPIEVPATTESTES